MNFANQAPESEGTISKWKMKFSRFWRRWKYFPISRSDVLDPLGWRGVSHLSVSWKYLLKCSLPPIVWSLMLKDSSLRFGRFEMASAIRRTLSSQTWGSIILSFFRESFWFLIKLQSPSSGFPSFFLEKTGSSIPPSLRELSLSLIERWARLRERLSKEQQLNCKFSAFKKFVLEILD